MKLFVNGKNFDDLPPEEQKRLKAKWANRTREMLALGKPPRVSTDDTFLAPHGANGRQFEGQPEVGDFYRRKAEEAGVSTTGKVYLNALAAFPGDPEAWVNGKGDVTRVCEKRGWECDGLVKVAGREFEHAPGPAVAEDIVRREVAEHMAVEPDARPGDVREAVVERLKPHWSE